MRVAIIDFETANRFRSSACQLGIAMIEGDQIVATREWLIRPTPFRFDLLNVEIHGITEDKVVRCPEFGSVWAEAQDFIGDAVVAAHNASFDTSVLRHAILATAVTFPTFDYFCTLKVARAKWPHFPCHRLSFLAEYFAIGLSSHDALSDAKATADLLLQAMSESGIPDVSEFLQNMNISLSCFHETSESIRPRVKPIPKSLDSLKRFLDGTLNSLESKTVAFTGDLKWITRETAAELVVAAGGEFHAAPKRGTTMLVVGDVDIRVLAKGETQSGKLKKAIELKSKGQEIEITTASDFLQSLFQSDLPQSAV